MASDSPSWRFYWFLGILYFLLIGGLTLDLFIAKLYGPWLFVVTTFWLYLAGDVVASGIDHFLKFLKSRYGMLVRFVVLTGAIVIGANASNYFQDWTVNTTASLPLFLRSPIVAFLSFFGPMFLFVDFYIHSDEYKN